MKVLKDNLLSNQQGSSIVYALIFVMMMGYMGTALVHVGTAEDENAGNNVFSQKNLYIGHAGLEVASHDIKYGIAIDGETREFASGRFDLFSNPAEGIATVHSQTQKAEKIQKISDDFAQQCLRVDTSAAAVVTTRLEGVRIALDCPEHLATVKIMGLDWDVMPRLPAEEPAPGFECPAEPAPPTNYADYLDPSDPSRIMICHIPMENPSWARTESVSVEQWCHSHHEGSAAHGMDYLGACNDEETTQQRQSFCYNNPNDVGGPIGDRDSQFSDEQHRGGISLKRILVSGELSATFYDGLGGVGTPLLEAGPNQPIDGEDFTMNANGNYGLDFEFTDDIPAGTTTFWLTIHFADGSERSYGFQVNS